MKTINFIHQDNLSNQIAEYKEVVSESIKLVGGEKCASRIENAFKEIERLVAENEAEFLKDLFNLCYPLDVTNKLDVMNFLGDLGDQLSGVVQYHRISEIQNACEIIENEQLDDLHAFADFFNQGSSRCFNHLYQSIIDYYLDYDWNSPPNFASKAEKF